MAPAMMIDPTVRPTKVDRTSDVTGLVDTGELGTLLAQPGDAVAVMESIERISEHEARHVSTRSSAIHGDADIKKLMQCGYVKTADLAEQFGNPAALDPGAWIRDIIGPAGIFTDAEYDGRRRIPEDRLGDEAGRQRLRRRRHHHDGWLRLPHRRSRHGRGPRLPRRQSAWARAWSTPRVAACR